MDNIVDILIKNNKYRLKNKFTNEIIGPFIFIKSVVPIIYNCYEEEPVYSRTRYYFENNLEFSSGTYDLINYFD
jgi:hypothetical protein